MSKSRTGYAQGKFRLGFTLSDLIPGTPHAKCRTPGAGERRQGQIWIRLRSFRVDSSKPGRKILNPAPKPRTPASPSALVGYPTRWLQKVSENTVFEQVFTRENDASIFLENSGRGMSAKGRFRLGFALLEPIPRSLGRGGHNAPPPVTGQIRTRLRTFARKMSNPKGGRETPRAGENRQGREGIPKGI